MVEPGRTCLGGRYELGGLIAAGGMGQVWRGTDVVLGRPVAVKVLRSEFTGDPSFLARFRAEAQNAAALSHPRIAAVFDYGETTAEDGSGETLAYLVMELVEGEPLSDLLHRSGRLDTATTLRILGQTAAGLAEAHRAGMVHRDVKPGNILVTPAGDVKITDFGIAWSARSVALTRTGQVLGTPQYLSPEQAEGRLATPASDVYALGLIGYECLAGHAAFGGDNPVAIALKQVREEPEPLPDDLPAGIRALVQQTLEKDPARRLPDGAAFLAAIETVRAGRSLPPGPPTEVLGAAVPAARPRARSRRSRMAVVLLPLLGLLLGAGIAAMVFQGLTDGGQSTAEAAQARAGEQSIVLAAADYVGRPADEVADELVALGLTVQREIRRTDEVAVGAVAGLDPVGTALSPGDSVVLFVAVAPGGATGDAGAATEEASTRPSAPAESSAPRTAAASTAPAEPAGEGTAGARPGTAGPATGTGPVDEQPAEEAPADEAPADEAPAEEAPADEAPVDQAPVDQAPADEPPAEEAPVDQAPVDEPPVDEPPAEEAPVDETPADGTPADGAATGDPSAEGTSSG